MNNSAFRFTKSFSRDFRNDPSPINQKKDPRLDLRVYLDSHQNSKGLRLSDMVFGDEGAEIVAEFLEKNKKIESLELRGNALSAEGFARICESLIGNNVIKTLSAEWNNIGSGIRGLEALAEFLAQNNTLEHLDLRNNKITSSASQSIANIIRSSTSLVNLDLRWNELGNQGAKAISGALETNDKILYVELKGNNITEELLEEINAKLEQNRAKGTAERFGRTQEIGNRGAISIHNYGTGERFRAPKSDHRDEKEIFADLQAALHANTELERALLVESRKNAELKEKFYKDLDLTTRELQNKIDHLLRENAAYQSQIKSIEADNARMKKENQMLQDKIAKYENDHLADVKNIEEYERTIRKLEQDLKSNDANLRSTIERLTNDHHLKTVELENNFDLKFKELSRENEYLTQRNRDLEVEVKRLAEENRSLMFGLEDKVRDASFKAREEERQKGLATIRQLETSLRAAEEEIFRYQRELEEKDLSYQRRNNYLEDRLHSAEEEIKRLKYEVTTNVDYYNKEKLRGESLQNEIMNKDNQILKLESDVRELKKTLHNKEVLYQEQIDILNREHEDEKERWEETKGTLQNRISDLERQNRQALSDLNRVRSDMQRASELLVSNLSQTVYRTFSELGK